MARPPRVQYENAFYHVMNRGRGRRWIFHGEAYYEAFLGTLEEAHDRHDARIHETKGVRSCSATWATETIVDGLSF